MKPKPLIPHRRPEPPTSAPSRLVLATHGIGRTSLAARRDAVRTLFVDLEVDRDAPDRADERRGARASGG